MGWLDSAFARHCGQTSCDDEDDKMLDERFVMPGSCCFHSFLWKRKGGGHLGLSGCPPGAAPRVWRAATEVQAPCHLLFPLWQARSHAKLHKQAVQFRCRPLETPAQILRGEGRLQNSLGRRISLCRLDRPRLWFTFFHAEQVTVAFLYFSCLVWAQ